LRQLQSGKPDSQHERGGTYEERLSRLRKKAEELTYLPRKLSESRRDDAGDDEMMRMTGRGEWLAMQSINRANPYLAEIIEFWTFTFKSTR